MNSTYVMSNIGTRVSPVTEQSMIGGTQKVSSTGVGSVVSATTQLCASCLVKPGPFNTGAVYATINKSDRAGTANVPTTNSFPLDASATSIPVGNLNLLSFYFAGASDVVHILWRNVITPDQQTALNPL
jgi:hypothetical protein